MVGVPRSRGCQACRKQKKKCVSKDDLPPCQRCKRLGVECLELGLRRLKFQNENDKLAILTKKQVTLEPTKKHHFIPNESSQYLDVLRPPPSSALTRLRAGYIRAIDGSVDISVHLPWNYGPYLQEVPLYLGRSEAFDLAAEALADAYGALRRDTKPGRDQKCLTRYSMALRVLAQALDAHVTATSTETLCAISMIMIFESICGFGAKSVLAHAGGAAKIFKARGTGNPRNGFEAMLQLSLRGAIVMQALFLPPHYFTDAEWKSLTESQIGADSPKEKAFRCLAEYAQLLERAGALFDNDETNKLDLQALAADSKSLKDRLEIELESLRQAFWQLTMLIRSGVNSHAAETEVGQSRWDLNTYHALVGRSYGLAMATQVLINSLLRAAAIRSIDDKIPELRGTGGPLVYILECENADLAREACQLAREANRHRPLGTLYMPRVLHLVSIGASGMAYDPIKELSQVEMARSNSLMAVLPSLLKQAAPGSKTIDCELPTHQVISDECTPELQGLTALEDLETLLRSYLSDFGETPTVREIEQSLHWLRNKFTFCKIEPHDKKWLETSRS